MKIDFKEFHPHVAVLIQDSQEGYHLVCNQRMNSKCQRPCRFCWIHRDNCNNPDAAADVRTAEDNMNIVADLKSKLPNMSKKEVEASLKEVSLSCLHNGLWGAPFGHPVELGVNGAALPDMLHQYLLGILKKAFTYTLSTIKYYGSQKGNLPTKLRMIELDKRFKTLNVKHCDAHMPRHRLVV